MSETSPPAAEAARCTMAPLSQRVVTHGTVLPLPEGTCSAADVLLALRTLCPAVPYSLEEMNRFMRYLPWDAEPTPFTTVLFSAYSEMKSGSRLRRWLVLSQGPQGRRVYWMLSVRMLDRWLYVSSYQQMLDAVEMFTVIGGGQANPALEFWTMPPSASEAAQAFQA